MTSRSNYGKLVHQGQGGFLNPPTHPEHDWCVHSSYDDTFWLSLTAAAESEWLNSGTRLAAKAKLRAWQPLPITDEAVQDWIHQVLGYFHNCYKGEDGPEAWHAGKLRISEDADPVASADLHAGVHLIRRYYPEYQPTAEDFKAAYWGTKPVAV